MKETDLQMKETDKIIKELSKNIGGIANSNGAMAEEMIYNALDRNKTFGGIKFDDIDRNVKLHLKKLNLKGEFDVVLENGDTLAIIETKYKVQKEHIPQILKMPDNFRKLFPIFKDYKIILGVGGMSFDDDVPEDAIKNGIGIIKIVGENVEFYTDNIKMF